MKMDINKIKYIYLSIMDEFRPMIYLFSPIYKWNSSIWNHSSMDTFIDVGGLKYLKLQVQSSKLKF
jgi:hypothetical protein